MPRNVQLLKERSWFDIPIIYNNNRRAILAPEQGTPGEQVFNRSRTTRRASRLLNSLNGRERDKPSFLTRAKRFLGRFQERCHDLPPVSAITLRTRSASLLAPIFSITRAR
jgi:hypothetical protein